MKIVGIIGGISWVSTIDYYRAINEGINEKLGATNFAECMIYSLNYQDIINNNNSGNLEKTYTMLLNAAIQLKNSGATAILLAANTMNMFAERIEAEIKIPVIHIATVTANEIKAKGLKKVGLLGTKFTMEMDFFKDKLKVQNIETIIPDEADREFIHHSIFEELGKGILKEETRARYIAIIEKLHQKGAEGIILGCTEIPLLIKDTDYNMPLFNTILIHCRAAVDFALSRI
jgi:aspartate racemase